jgi:hypothetical protein
MLKNRCCPWFDKLTMRAKPLKTRDLILSLSKDEAKISCFFSSLLVLISRAREAFRSVTRAGTCHLQDLKGGRNPRRACTHRFNELLFLQGLKN